MSSDDAQYTYATLKPLIIALACETGFYVLSILSFAVSTYILVRKGLKTRAILIMWITTFIMFAVSTCHFLLQWVGGMDKIRTGLASSFLEDYYGEQLLSIADIYLPIVNYSLSDGIVLWRVWVMWERSVKVLIFPVLFYCTLAAGLYMSFSRLGIGLIYASTLTTNIIATTLMAVKAWQHRRLLKSHLNNTEYRSWALSVLVLLVESGTLYCVIWTIFFLTWCFVSSNFNVTSASVMEILPGITVQVSGIYPTAVIALAALQRTTWDMSVGRDMFHNAPHVEMRFATRDTRSVSSTIQSDHRPTPSDDEELHASEMRAMNEEA
ncbi:hypothetical protein HETIRDRAFT_473768 [Heterobasidion irregulare TC 32-1]|uniref:Uncharacterized protein n=1 Tax=Heterobasidion irregulare (strain TC 32-1) TaxID=747525 RepID=W4K9U9_HETIT|nr:uncharacterized protein HETIRDRAFT_473768 [Heterobasidion irregulare TC 32-1]ETW82622.1 hypothetical protein HETIRDRAFT_473768 [Heterobasidion irregulare TC 32-1]